MADEAPTLKFAQVEELVAAMLRVDQTQRTKLVGRFKQLKRLGFPPGVNIKTGRFAYDFDATIRCALAFALMNALLPTRAAVELLSQAWEDIRKEVAAVLRSLHVVDGRIDLSQRPADGKFIMIATGNLDAWASRNTDDEKGQLGSAEASLSVVTAEELKQTAGNSGAGAVAPSRLVVDLWAPVAWSADFLLEKGWMKPAQLAKIG